MDRRVLALSYCDFLKTEEKLLLLRSFSSFEDLLSASLVDISFIINRRIKSKMRLSDLSPLVEKALKAISIYKIKMLMIEDEGFPLQLKEIPDPPFSLFIRGIFPDVGSNMVSIVGTRMPTGEGIKEALHMGIECADLALPVICFPRHGCVPGHACKVRCSNDRSCCIRA